MKYKFLEHTADIKFQAFGKSIEEVFENSAWAMFNAMYDGKVKSSSISKKLKINVKGKDFESLMYNFLEEFLVLLDSEGFFLSKIEKIKIDKKKFTLNVEVSGNNSENYEISQHIKAVTYNDMFIHKEGKKWIAQVVIDV
jgi:SHS2 domain-containing protein|tara:strand:+ start:15772 stop:16191 length:420 start_codon:yes stop_codon:yes gene_type:complete